MIAGVMMNATAIVGIRRCLSCLVLLVLCGVVVAVPRSAAVDEKGAASSLRLVSLNPSLTAIVLQLGRGDLLVGIDDYSAKILPELSDLPRVGGLFDPSLESIVSLRPDLVLLVAGVDQQSHAERLEKLGLAVEIYRNERLDEVLENIERLGAQLDRKQVAADRIRAILDMRDAVKQAANGRIRPATLAVVDRSPLFVVGADTFLDEMLESVGARNLARTLGQGYPRGSIEWLIGAGPELLLDMTPGAERASDFWARWPSIPAVGSGRVVDVDASRISLPGPGIDQALRELAVAVHGDEIMAEIDRALRKESVP